ncbi:MAG: hypothetical protein AAGA83_25225 [Cyanobacteria bacterium P01_F01_bin.116]
MQTIIPITSSLRTQNLIRSAIPITTSLRTQNLIRSAHGRSGSWKWKRLMTGLTLWVLGEVLLGAAGLDDLADYSEFLSDRYEIVLLAKAF